MREIRPWSSGLGVQPKRPPSTCAQSGGGAPPRFRPDPRLWASGLAARIPDFAGRSGTPRLPDLSRHSAFDSSPLPSSHCPNLVGQCQILSAFLVFLGFFSQDILVLTEFGNFFLEALIYAPSSQQGQ